MINRSNYTEEPTELRRIKLKWRRLSFLLRRITLGFDCFLFSCWTPVYSVTNDVFFAAIFLCRSDLWSGDQTGCMNTHLVELLVSLLALALIEVTYARITQALECMQFEWAQNALFIRQNILGAQGFSLTAHAEFSFFLVMLDRVSQSTILDTLFLRILVALARPLILQQSSPLRSSACWSVFSSTLRLHSRYKKGLMRTAVMLLHVWHVVRFVMIRLAGHISNIW